MIGTILTPNKKLKLEGFNITDSFENANQLGLPILVDGYYYAKSLGFVINDIFQNQIDENVFWTFSKDERYIEYEKMIALFTEHCLKQISEKVRYFYFDVNIASRELIKRFMKMMNDEDIHKTILFDNNFFYVKRENDIIGVSRYAIEYGLVDYEKVVSKIRHLKNCQFLEHLQLSFDLQKVLKHRYIGLFCM